MAIVKAEAVFTAEAGFSEKEVARIWAVAAGRMVSFPRAGTRTSTDEHGRTRPEVLTEYARGATADEVAAKHGMSRRRMFYLLRRERTEGTQETKMQEWKNRGLSLREIGRLYGKSYEAVRLVKGSTKSQAPKPKEESGTEQSLEGSAPGPEQDR